MEKCYSDERTVCFMTLGCKVNQTESEALAQLFREKGYIVVDKGDEAGIVVVNTCTVTNTGDAKSRQMIRRMIKVHPESFVVVTGCYAQTSSQEIMAIEGVDLLLGTQDRNRILELIDQVKKERSPRNAVHDIEQKTEFEELPQLQNEHRTRATLKIEEGCDQFCTYCIIPYARGPVRSRLPHNTLAEAKSLVESGFKEIVLTGIHLGAYGKDLTLTDGTWDLARLIRHLIEIPGLERLRLSSIEPMEVNDDLVTVFQMSSKLCPHLHIPLQSGSDAVLARMNRPYTLDEYAVLLKKLKKLIPGLAVTTDVIVGFPGEEELDHYQALQFIERCGFAGIHVFPYSKRKGTPAAEYPDQIPRKIKEERVRELMAIGKASKEAYAQRFIGQTLDVLIEKVDDMGRGIGHTPNYLEVILPAALAERGQWLIGERMAVEIKEEYLLTLKNP